MGIPIPVIEVDAGRARWSSICLAADCHCPECRHRHIIRLGSAIRQTTQTRRRQELHNFASSSSSPRDTIAGTGNAAATTGPDMPIHSGYIDTRLPDYRFRHSLSPPDPTASISDYRNVHRNNHGTLEYQRDRRRHNRLRLSRNVEGGYTRQEEEEEEEGDSGSSGSESNNYSTSALMNRRRGALGYRGPPLTQIISSSSASFSNLFLSPMMGGGNSGSSREPFTVSPTSLADTLEREQEEEQEQERTEQLEMVFEATILEDTPQDQHRHQQHQHQQLEQQQYQRPPPPSSPLTRMRARAQEWASRMEGVDYYHDSDPEDLPLGGAGDREGEGARRERWMMRRHGGEVGHRGIIMDRHERSSSDVGIEQSTIG